MKLKYFISALMLITTSAFAVAQLNIVKANTGNLLSPATSPISSPISAPISFYTYRLQGRIGLRSITGVITPLQNITVQLVNQTTKEIFSAVSNTNGGYVITVVQNKPTDNYILRIVNDSLSNPQRTATVSGSLYNMDFTVQAASSSAH